MAAPGLGIGDIVNACAFIYDMCVKYKDAPKEFDEIADKAKSTAAVLERIRREARMGGNLVERAGPQGYSQLKHHLKGLKSDSKKLEALVAKYARIHDEGPGRRMLFTVMESSGLTDLRRRIGLHEQMLEMWYMTLIYGSLRRLEGGQEDILKAIEAMKKWSPTKRQHVRRSVREGDSKPLEQELCKSGLDPIAVKSALGAAVEYVDSPPREQVKMESRAKSSSVLREKGSSFGEEPSFGYSRGFGDSYGDDFGEMFGDKASYPAEFSELHRRKSTGSRRKPRFGDLSIDSSSDDELIKEEFIIRKKSKDKEASRRRDGDSYETRPRSSSHHDPYPVPPSPLLVVPPRHHHRSKSQQIISHLAPYEGPIVINPSKQPQRHRSHSRSHSRSPHPPAEYDIIESQRRRSHSRSPHATAESVSDVDIIRPERRRRDSSTHSYTRERERDPGSRRRSTSRGRHGGDEVLDRRRIVTKMDRIDSIPIDKS